MHDKQIVNYVIKELPEWDEVPTRLISDILKAVKYTALLEAAQGMAYQNRYYDQGKGECCQELSKGHKSKCMAGMTIDLVKRIGIEEL